MTNCEKHRDALKEYACGDSGYFGVRKDTGEVTDCATTSCSKCIFGEGSVACSKSRMKWLVEEYKEPKKPEIDWNKVPVDTPIIVTWGCNKLNRYFAKYKNGEIYAWSWGATSWSIKDQGGSAEPWDDVEIAPGIDCSKWYKE